MSETWAKFGEEVWAWFTSTRMQVFFGGVMLLYFRDRLGIDDETAAMIRQGVLAVVIGVSVRDIVKPQGVQA